MADHDKRREWHWRRIEVIGGVVATIVAVIGLFITIGQNQGSAPSATDTRPQPTPTGSPNSGSEPTLPAAQYTVAYTDKALTLPNTNVSDPGQCGRGAFVDFSVPKVVEESQSDLFLQTSCSPRGLTLSPENSVTVSTHGVKSASGCQDAIDSAPISFGETIRLGATVCVKSPNGVIASFRWTGVSGGNARIVISAWRTS
jgi:hypothetical protein